MVDEAGRKYRKGVTKTGIKKRGKQVRDQLREQTRKGSRNMSKKAPSV